MDRTELGDYAVLWALPVALLYAFGWYCVDFVPWLLHAISCIRAQVRWLMR